MSRPTAHPADAVTAPDRPGGLDAVCLGETMALLTPATDTPLDARPHLTMEVGGAESNVACSLARLGHRAAWLSRVGDDPFGRLVTGELAAHGVDVSGVETDPDRPTGMFVKDPAPGGSRVHYYRAGSAASAMGPELARSAVVGRARILHLSGITPALSAGCAALVERLTTGRTPDQRPPRGPLVSFDVNHRPGLWRDGRAAGVLLSLARAADLVFVGRDEAETLWGTASADDVRELLGDTGTLVVKDAAHGATSFGPDGTRFVPALPVDVVEPVGAGDAFAAGYLSGLLDGRPPRDRLRLGHLAAAAALRTLGDLADVPPAADRERLLALADADWPTGALPLPAPRRVAG